MVAKGKQIYICSKEKITLQTILAMEIRNNEECKKHGIIPCFRTAELITLYEKVAGHEYKERR